MTRGTQYAGSTSWTTSGAAKTVNLAPYTINTVVSDPNAAIPARLLSGNRKSFYLVVRNTGSAAARLQTKAEIDASAPSAYEVPADGTPYTFGPFDVDYWNLLLYCEDGSAGVVAVQEEI